MSYISYIARAQFVKIQDTTCEKYYKNGGTMKKKTMIVSFILLLLIVPMVHAATDTAVRQVHQVHQVQRMHPRS